MPSPLSPLSSSSTFCLELPELPPEGMKPLPLPVSPGNDKTYWRVTNEPGTHMANVVLPTILDMDETVIRITHPDAPMDDNEQEGIETFGPMRVTSCAAIDGGARFVFAPGYTGEAREAHIPNSALSVCVSVPSCDGNVKAVVSRPPPPIKEAYYAAKKSPHLDPAYNLQQ